MLETRPNFNRPDESYALLIKAHEGLSEAESHAMNARLILILMNQIGDHAIIADALSLARKVPAAT
ncbi:DUF2783 domain-containing protein [Rhizobium hidalgonense]|uniref:DUF2783 domain-containing protein n=1 Tax=Rhizobium hidalgonense TaxID=1538159 RepID=UPI001105CDCE|nr:DUF2783 domain-containing protein [Rhizobium hidalgonense]QKK27004.1 DUF2783 domain-containing protein [Rhizobium hidalgonense]